MKPLVLVFILSGGIAQAGEHADTTQASCHVSLVEITPEGFTRSPAAVAEFQSTTAKGGDCAEEMKNHVKDFARGCHSPNHVLAEINFTASEEKSVEAELAMECGAVSKRNPASEESDHVNRYINEAYNQIQSNYDRNPLTSVNLRTPRTNQKHADFSTPSTTTHGVVYGSENLHTTKRQWLQNKPREESATSPDEVVEKRIQARQVAAADDNTITAEQNAYIQEFIQNAQADGWSIRIKNGRINVVPKER